MTPTTEQHRSCLAGVTDLTGKETLSASARAEEPARIAGGDVVFDDELGYPPEPGPRAAPGTGSQPAVPGWPTSVVQTRGGFPRWVGAA